MYRCLSCHKKCETPDTHNEYLEGELVTSFYVCPNCKGDVEKMYLCPICHEADIPVELDCCEDCKKDIKADLELLKAKYAPDDIWAFDVLKTTIVEIWNEEEKDGE